MKELKLQKNLLALTDFGEWGNGLYLYLYLLKKTIRDQSWQNYFLVYINLMGKLFTHDTDLGKKQFTHETDLGWKQQPVSFLDQSHV